MVSDWLACLASFNRPRPSADALFVSQEEADEATGVDLSVSAEGETTVERLLFVLP